MTKRERAVSNALTGRRAFFAATTALAIAGSIAMPGAAYATTSANALEGIPSPAAKTAQATTTPSLTKPVEAPQAFTTSNIESSMKAISPAMSSLKTDNKDAEAAAAAAAAAAAVEAAPADERMLPFDMEIVDEVGTQISTGHTSCCLAFSQAYGESFLTDSIVDHTAYAMYGSCAYSPCASYGPWTDWRDDLGDVCRAIDDGQPAVVHVRGYSGYEHWVLAIGYVDAPDFDDVSLDNIIVVDPWDGEIINASDRFVRYWDGQIRLAEDI